MDSKAKYEEKFQFFFDESRPIEREKTYLTPLEAVDIINKALLEVQSEKTVKDLERLKKYLKK